MRIKEKLYPKYDPNPTYSPKNLIDKAMIRYQNCDMKKSQSQIRQEIAGYKKFWKCYPHDYFLNDLYRKDCTLTKEKLTDYIPGFFWYYLFLPHHNSYKYHIIPDNKIIMEQFFRSLNIAQPETLCRIINNQVYSREMVRCSFDAVRNELAEILPEKIFVKPAEGGGSKGIFVFYKDAHEKFFTREAVPFDEAFISSIAKQRDYIIQIGVKQDKEMSAVNPDSVNTCRILTENYHGNSRVVCAMLRIGRHKSDFDNISTGGVSLKIDLNSGKTGNMARSYENETFFEHPDSHYKFDEFRISQWNEICKFTINSAAKIPYFTHLGWDIAITPGGPLAIEVNLGTGIEALQMANGGLRKAIGIDNPDYFWKNPGKR